jgi:Mg-chelatase subunit ChlD
MTEPIARWRLVLGHAAEGALGESALDLDDLARDAALEWLYGRDPERAGRDIARDRRGSSERPQLAVPDWIEEVHRLFPKETVERIERDAVERFQIDEVVTNPEVLARVEPSEALLRAVLRTKHLMRQDVLDVARRLVAEVVARLMSALAREVRRAFGGSLDRRRRSPLRIARNLDFRRTLRDNLHRWSPEQRKLFLEAPIFFARTKRHTDRWQIVLLVDQSASMAAAVIHSAVTAACLWSLPGMKTHLVAFDTEVVDLTSDVTDPVELLMKVQLGGGTDIAKAVAYAAELVEAPRRSIVVLITDFFEGGSPELLVRRVRGLVEQGTIVLGLGALDREASPEIDRALAQRLADAGAHVGAMTPGELAGFIAEKVRA